MSKKSNKIVAAILAAVFSIQMMVISDGALFTPNNISAFGDFIEEQVNKKSLKNEFNEAVSKLGNIDYFDKNNLVISKTIYSAEEIGISNTLYLKGYIGLVHGGDNTKIKILVFNGWDLVEETYAYADGSFEVYAYGLTGETNIKIECDGYLPRFYKGMGYGEYQLGYSDEPEMLYPGDTLYNEWESNQWSDEVINANDADFVYGFIGLHKGSENYLAEYDFDENGVIDDDDFSIYEAYLGVTNDHEDYVPFLDVDENGIIDELDYDSVYNFCYGTYAGDADYRDYMDINKNGVIDSDDHAWFVNYCQVYDGYNSENSYMKNITLLGDCYIPGSFNLHDANLDLNGCVLSVEDCMSFTTDNPSLWSDGEGGEGATLDLYGGKLIIANNFVFRTASPDGWGGPTAQALEMNCGTLDIGGDFDFGQAHCYDYIVMENPEDELWISGNWNYVTSMDMEGLWTAGTIYFCGSTWQVNELSGEKSIFSSDYHNIVFFYEYGQQVIRWDNPKDYWYETDRQFNFELYTDLENLGYGGMFFPYGFSEDLYLFRPALPFDFEDGFDMYRNGWEMGDGIDLATGNYTKSFVDMSVNSPGLNIDFIRTFNSTSEEIGALGKGWDFNIDVSKILIPSPGYYQVVLPDGSNSTFKNENGIYECQNNRNKMRTTNGEYIITIANQTEYYYKNNSKSELYLYKIVDVNANKMEISDVINNERTITDSLNGTYTIQYENDRVKSITDNQSARTVTYDYNNSNLVSVTDANGAVETYGYDSNSRLNQITNPCGQVTEQIFYHNDGKVDYLFNANGLKQVYQYDRLRKNTEIHEYDGDELVKRTACDYDEKHAINTNIVYADGQRYEIEKVIYDTDSSGKNRYSDTKEHIDELGNKTVYDRDENGNITKTLYPDGTVTRARFNSQNSPLIQVDAMNNVNLFVYDETGVNVLKEAQSLTKLTDADIDALLANEDVTNYLNTNFANFAVTTYDYIDYNVSNVRILGLIRTITDPEGNVTEYEYNTNGTLAKEFKYKGSKPAYSTNYEYNDIWLPSRTTSAEGHVQEFDYDKNGNQIRVKDFGKRKDEVLPAPAITRTVYDSAGRKIKEVAPEFYNNSLEQTNGYGYDVNNTDTANYATYSYYPSGLVLTMTAPEGNITSFVYDVYGNQVKETKADGTQNIIEYDKMGRALRSYFKESETSGNRVLLSESWIGNPFLDKITPNKKLL